VTHPLHTPATIRALLAEHDLAPRKAAGQNFVVDPNTVRKVVRDAGVVAGEVVCEIGPGLGSLTLALREAAARVVAVEVDAGLVRALQRVLGDDDGFELVHADALTVDFAALVADARARWGGDGPVPLVANLPYNIATPLVFRALESAAFDPLLVMVQREVGERWTAAVADALYSGVSVKLAALADARVVARVARGAFYPVPNVDSVTVRLDRRLDSPASTSLFRLVDDGFGQRRKRLRNSLARPDRPPARVEEALERATLDRGARPEELTLADWLRLHAALS
jgi:16S rRNA (adenine1518-N6/adenine1519-N6)-dimethyltransferase